ncbi:DUF3883 domain-containing protein [Microbacterium sp. A8/3-1]|uniref:DUF3883 domain-containing protein n=1 Tax=Microbacterium sp. A8/3-1 TaxID=3160749 RepID=A0AAU7VTG3_9MICO
MHTWRESIIEALSALDGEGQYDEIYAEVAARRGALPPSWQAIVRRTIQQSSSDSAAFIAGNGDVFYSTDGLGRGRWGLRLRPPALVGMDTFVGQWAGLGQGLVSNSVVRSAIEMHAVTAAVAYYESLGARDVEEVGKPYDLRMTLEGREAHVEVKGSTRTVQAVTLTRNEVLHARSTIVTQLVVVDQIELQTDHEGLITTSGGRMRIWQAWAPSDESLTATVYQHTLPLSSGAGGPKILQLPRYEGPVTAMME